MRTGNRGIALFLTMGFTAILVMMLAATLTSTHGANIFTQDYHRKTAALYAAESGLALVQERLESNPDWDSDLIQQETAFGTGSYTVRFGPSINNLRGTTEIMGPYGPVLPGTAFLRVEGRAMGQTEIIECTLGRKSEDFLHTAIITTGKIYLDGMVKISGRVSSNDLGQATADVISNYDEDAPWEDGTRPVNWASSPSAGDEVRGTVRSASPASGAISSNLVSISDLALTDQAPVPVQNINIKRAIQSKSGVSHSVPTSPTAPLSGDYYEGGNKTVAGDLVLDNASLYIRGDLTVLGSIRGVGAVYVGGDTQFSGDSVVVANEDGVVVYSQGNVHLRGFDGTAWMDAVTGNSAAWQKTKAKMGLLHDHLQEYAQGTTAPMVPPGSDENDYWASPAGLALAVLSAPIPQPSGDPETNLLYQMVQVIDSQPSGRTRDFMSRKFTELRNPDRVSKLNPPVSSLVPGNIRGALGINYGDPAGNAEPFHQFLGLSPYESMAGRTPSVGLQLSLWMAASLHRPGGSGFEALTQSSAPYDGLTVPQLKSSLTKYTHWLNLYDFDRLGASYFQGSIYTRGALYASNEVTIIGSLSAVADPEEPATVWNPAGGGEDDSNISLKPGDVHLGRGTRILHVSDLLPGPRVTAPPVGVSQWLR